MNCLTSSDVTTPIAFPDVDTASVVDDDEFRFEVLPGDFSEAHRNMDGGPVDAVVTSFFLDAARNPIDTVRDLVLFLLHLFLITTPKYHFRPVPTISISEIGLRAGRSHMISLTTK